MTALIPDHYRRPFFNLCSADETMNYDLVAARGLTDNASNVLGRQWRYSRQAMAALDLGADMAAVQGLLAEAALASTYYLQGTEDGPGILYAFYGFFAHAVVGDEAANREYARLFLERTSQEDRKPFDAQLETLARALASSIIGNERDVTAALARAKKLPANKRRKTHAPWFASLLKLADTCLLGATRDLAPLALEVVQSTAKYFTASDISGQSYDPFLNRTALAFVARAQVRGFDLSTPNPHPSIRLDVLRLPASSVPRHPWHTWPKPSARHFAKIKQALSLAENTGKVSTSARKRPPARGRRR